MKSFMNKNTVQFFTYDLSRFMLICAFMLNLSVHVFTFLVVKATKTIQRTSMAKTCKNTKKHHTFDHKTSHKTEFPHGISSPGLCLGRHCFADVHKVCGTMSTPQRSVKSESNSRQKIANHSQKCRKNSDVQTLHEFT